MNWLPMPERQRKCEREKEEIGNNVITRYRRHSAEWADRVPA